MRETVEWLRDRPFHHNQIVTHRVVDGQQPNTAEIDLNPTVESALAGKGVTSIFSHQAKAINAVRDGENIVLATPTASGKSLAYTIPALESALQDGGRTLYIGPQVALINDQEETLQELTSAVDGFDDDSLVVSQYTGRTERSRRPGIREGKPNILQTTPDMLHCGILPHASNLWSWFFRNLEYVVIDEVHVYRGVLGSHVGLVMRRLNRLCERFDASPQFICCSATIGNPVEHAATITGQPTHSYSLVNEDKSGTGNRHWIFWNPFNTEETEPEDGFQGPTRGANHQDSLRLFTDLVTKGYQTAVFTRARQTAERYAAESADELSSRGHHDLANSVTAYHGSLTDTRRNKIEAGLHDGSLAGVWSTNALELGVDIGGLDAVVLDGYPGTRMQSNQRAGRAGRGEDPCLVVFVGGPDQLDQYVLNNPETLFEQQPENAIADPMNRYVLSKHVLCAAEEQPLATKDEHWFGPDFPDVISELEDNGSLERSTSSEGMQWRETEDENSLAYDLPLRSIEDRQVRLYDRLSVPESEDESDDLIGKMQFSDALRDAHPGAIYFHQGRKYEIIDLDLDEDVALLESTGADYYTQPLYEIHITVDEVHESKPLATTPDVTVQLADVTVHRQIQKYERRFREDSEPAAVVDLDLPVTTMQTKAMTLSLPSRIDDLLLSLSSEMTDMDDDAAISGAYHAGAHAVQSMLPTELLCDRRDIGKTSNYAPDSSDPSQIVVYDNHPGGVGLSEGAYQRIESLVERTREVVTECDCESGCPSCIQAPHCGLSNEGLPKGLTEQLLHELVD